MRKLSIITINLNNKEGLQKTIASVLSQTFVDYEYIIIDGGSTDGSVKLLKENADEITDWVSEPDKGIYNAMNKGIVRAKGQYCLFLNSGDSLLDRTILEEIFKSDHQESILYGDLICGKKKLSFPSKLTFSFFMQNSIGHPSTFIKRELFLSYGYYNEEYKICADWCFFLKTIIVERCSYKYLNQTISVFDVHGISNTSDFELVIKKEKADALGNLCPVLFEKDAIIFVEKIHILSIFENSRIIQLVFKMHESSYYKRLKRIIKKMVR